MTEMSINDLFESGEKEEIPSSLPFNETIYDFFAKCSNAQMEYINNTEPGKRAANPALNLHFHQLQEPMIFVASSPEPSQSADISDILNQNNTASEALFENIENKDKAAKKPKRKKEYKGYPKKYIDPTDAEYEEKDGNYYYFFNIEKTLRKYNLMKITKLIPLSKLEDMTFDKAFFDNIAQKQHAKTELLNSYSGAQQHARDIKIRLIKTAVLLFSASLIFLYVSKVYMPKKAFEQGSTYLSSSDYENGYYVFSELGTYNDSYVYAKYCEGQMLIKKKEYDEAKECFELLLDYQDKFTEAISIQDFIYKCSYLKAIDLYNNSEYEEAKRIFKSIYKYEDATTYYYKCSCEIANQYYEQGDLYQAVENLYEPGTANYEDSYDRLITIADQIYNNAVASYNLGNYEEALADFKFLADYSYKDSETMVTQCSYQYALDLFEESNYTEARESFSEITEYKDSLALMKESTYQLAEQAYYQNPVTSISIYETILDYKDADDILTADRLCLYGRWNIIEQDSSVINPIEFSFYNGGLFYTKTQISGVAISTDATPYSYIWKSDHFEAINGEYTIYIEPIIDESYNGYSVDKIILICSNSTNTYKYSCERIYSYTEMIKKDNSVEDKEETILTLNQIISNQINDYIDKKTDGVVVINGTEVEITGVQAKLQDELSASISNDTASDETTDN